MAGFDLTFSPVKSVSTLWAVADPRTASAIEVAHHAAVGDALRFIEEHALFTRTGADGVRQVNVTGLVAAAFVHRDSRAGDPDFHIHVAVANKVQTLDGRWLGRCQIFCVSSGYLFERRHCCEYDRERGGCRAARAAKGAG